MEAVHTETHAGLTIEIHYDEDPTNPREWTQNGLMCCWHRRYNLGDYEENPWSSESFDSVSEIVAAILEDEDTFPGTPILPLYLYDHSGISMSVGENGNPFSGFDPGQWDSGFVGLIYATKERVEATGTALADLEKCLKGEVKEYDNYLTGQVFGYVVKDAAGLILDSCWGFVGDEEYAKTEARSMAEWHSEQLNAEVDVPDVERAMAAARSLGLVTA